jgi:hypothetical protein
MGMYPRRTGVIIHPSIIASLRGGGDVVATVAAAVVRKESQHGKPTSSSLSYDIVQYDLHPKILSHVMR